MSDLLLACAALLSVTDGSELVPSPFFALQWRPEIQTALYVRARSGRERIREARNKNGEPTVWQSVERPDATEVNSADTDRAIATSTGSLRGLLLFYDTSDLPRPLPTNIPFPLFGDPVNGLRLRVPHRVIRFHVLKDDESFTEWVSKYTTYCARQLRRECKTEVNEKHGTARMIVRGPVDRPVGRQPGMPDPAVFGPGTQSDRAVMFMGKRQLTREMTGFFRLIGRTVYRGETKALLSLRTDSLPDYSTRPSEDTWGCSWQPSGFPQKLRTAFLNEVTAHAFPELQQRDNETKHGHQQRVAYARWQLDALRILLQDVSRVRVAVRGITGTGKDPVEFKMTIRSSTGRLGKLIGQPDRPRSSRFSVSNDEAVSAIYGGTLPVTLRTALQQTATVNQKYASLAQLFSDRVDGALFLSIADSKPLVHGKFRTAAAGEIIRGIAGDKVRVGVPHVVRSERNEGAPGGGPQEIGFLSASSEMRFAAGNEGVEEKLRQVALEPEPKSGKEIFAFRCEFDRLAASPASSGFDGIPRRLLDWMEAAWFRACWNAHQSSGVLSTKSLLAQIEHFEKVLGRLDSLTPEVAAKLPDSVYDQFRPEYEQLARDYSFVRSVKFISKRDSFRHWLVPGTSDVQLGVRYSPTELSVSGTIGQSLLQVAQAHLAAANARANSYSAGKFSDALSDETISKFRELWKAQFGDRASPLLKVLEDAVKR